MLQKHFFKYPMLWLGLGWLLIAAIIYLSLLDVGPKTMQVTHGDKFGHVIAYGAAMFWFMQIYEDHRSRLLTAAGLLALGIALEFAQTTTVYRTFGHADMLANGIGIVLGWILSPPRTRNVLECVETVI
jgi:VanZ family protein